MLEFIGPVILGVFVIILGVFNTKGYLKTIRYHHRHRVAPEDVLPFGRLLGIGNIIMGNSIILYGLFYYVSEKTGVSVLSDIGTVILVLSVAIGIVISVYATVKYNKGLF